MAISSLLCKELMDITNLLIIIVGDYLLLNQNYRMLLTLVIPWVISKINTFEFGFLSNYFYSNDKKYCMELSQPGILYGFEKFLTEYFLKQIHIESQNNQFLGVFSDKGFYAIYDKEYKIPYQGKFLIAKKEKSDDDKTYVYKLWCCNLEVILHFIDSIKICREEKNAPVIRIQYSTSSSSSRIHTINSIRCPSILREPILDRSILKNLYNDIDRFISSQQEYIDKQKTYKRSYLFEGLPGTGKTSLIKHLGLKYKYNICLVNINSFTDILKVIDTIDSLMHKTIIVFEDFACKEDPVYNEKEEQINTLPKKDLINLLDGMLCPFNGHLIIMTTNYVDNIDPVLIRPGRIDYRINFTYATREQIDMHLKQENLEFPEKIINKYVGKATIAEVIYKIETNIFV